MSKPKTEKGTAPDAMARALEVLDKQAKAQAAARDRERRQEKAEAERKRQEAARREAERKAERKAEAERLAKLAAETKAENERRAAEKAKRAAERREARARVLAASIPAYYELAKAAEAVADGINAGTIHTEYHELDAELYELAKMCNNIIADMGRELKHGGNA